MENFLAILTKPDNLPIAAMAVALVFLLVVWLKEARANDRALEEEGEAGLLRKMQR